VASIRGRIVSFNKAKNKFVVLLWSSSLVKDQAMALTDEVAGLRIFCLLTYGGGSINFSEVPDFYLV